MTNLKPLRESSRDGFTKGLLESAFLDEPPRHSLRRTAAFLGVSEAAAAALAASTASAAATLSAGTAGAGKAALIAALKWLGAGAIAGVTTAGGIDYLSNLAASDSAAAHPPVVTRSATTEAIQLASPRAAPPPATAAPALDPEAPKKSPAARATAVRTRVPASAPSAATPDETPALDGEIRRLDRARAALSRGSPEGALAEIAAYETERKTAVLEREAAVLRIDAMLARGDRAGARALAERYVAAHPFDPHARRLRALIEPDGVRP